MTYIEELRQSRDKAQVAFLEFAQSTRKFSAHLFCFFEGKDNPYYIPRIRRFTEQYYPIKCGGREKVLEVYKIIINRPEYNVYKKAFFIDRDFNPPSNATIPPIFETPCYSIENFYVSVNVFKDILTNEFHVSEVNEQSKFEDCMALYVERQKEFHNAVSLFNAWYACLVDIKNETGKVTGATLGESSIFKGKDKEGGKKYLKFIDFTLQSVSSDYDFEKIKHTFPNATEVTVEMLKIKHEQFKNYNGCRVFRGKFEMQFLVRFIQLLLHDSFSTKKIIKSKINFAFGDASGLNNEQAINIFEGYADTPDSLNDYLKYVTK
jgi:uncharacterized protein YfbU (UPF0304 family)